MTSRNWSGNITTLTLLPFLNAGAMFLALYRMYESETANLGVVRTRPRGHVPAAEAISQVSDIGDSTATIAINLLHVAIAIAFITIAIPLKLDSHWITIGWLIDRAVLLWIAVRTQVNLVRIMAGCTLTLAIFRLVMIDTYGLIG